MISVTNRIISAVLLVIGCATLTLGQEKGKIARPVDTEKSFERSTFQADEHQVWTLLLKILTKHGFDFLIKDKNLGRIETNYIIFSRNPEFSKLSNGVKSLAKTPRIFLRNWIDGRIKIFAEVRRLSQNSTEVVLRPDIYGFAQRCRTIRVSPENGVSVLPMANLNLSFSMSWRLGCARKGR